MKYLLDADWIIDHLSGRQSARAAFPNLTRAEFAVCGITLIELYTGVFGSRNPQQSEQELNTLLRSLTTLPLNQRLVLQAARVRNDLLAGRLPIKHRAFDLVVAATALAYNLTVVTNNTKDYVDIPDIQLLNARAAG